MPRPRRGPPGARLSGLAAGMTIPARADSEMSEAALPPVERTRPPPTNSGRCPTGIPARGWSRYARTALLSVSPNQRLYSGTRPFLRGLWFSRSTIDSGRTAGAVRPERPLGPARPCAGLVQTLASKSKPRREVEVGTVEDIHAAYDAQIGDEHEIITFSFPGLNSVNGDVVPEFSVWPLVRMKPIGQGLCAESLSR